MTDLFRGYDLTTVADMVARKAYERDAANLAKETPWEEVSAFNKQQIKQSLLPLITDVLDALESDQVKPTEARQMVEYHYLGGDRHDPRWYENQDHQHSIETATVWALHLHVPVDEATTTARDRILERMSVLPEPTGEYTFGDSWRQWGEPSEGSGDMHMVVYFHATPERALAVGQHLATHATFAVRPPPYTDLMVEFGVSTSGDYAEQLTVS